jgi:MIP family channel proteins
MQVRLGPALVAEFVGSFALTFVGIMAIFSANLLAGDAPGAGLLVVALAHGLVLAVMVSATMQTSGGHINPAITIGFLVTGKIKPAAGIAYIVIQLGGGIVAALAVLALFGADAGRDIVEKGTPNLGADLAGAPVRPVVGFLAEIIATFFLAFAVWGTAADPRARNVGGFAIGLAVAFDILAVGPLTGASMNPQRSFGPTLVAGGAALWKNHWVYWAGPIVGACLASLIYHLILWPRDREAGIDAPAMDVPPTQRP